MPVINKQYSNCLHEVTRDPWMNKLTQIFVKVTCLTQDIPRPAELRSAASDPGGPSWGQFFALVITHKYTHRNLKIQKKTPRLTLLFPRNLAMVTLPKWHLGPQQWSVGTSRSHLEIHPIEKRENVCIIWRGTTREPFVTGEKQKIFLLNSSSRKISPQSNGIWFSNLYIFFLY